MIFQPRPQTSAIFFGNLLFISVAVSSWTNIISTGSSLKQCFSLFRPSFSFVTFFLLYFFVRFVFIVVSFYLMKWDCFATLQAAGNGTWTWMKNHVVVAWLLTSCRTFVVRWPFWFSVFRKMLVICFLDDTFYSCTSWTIYRGNIADICWRVVTYNCNMSVKVFYLQNTHSSILIA